MKFIVKPERARGRQSCEATRTSQIGGSCRVEKDGTPAVALLIYQFKRITF